MAIAGGITLGLACIFLFYVLVQFYLEATRPPRRHLPRAKRVIVFRKRIATEADLQDEAKERENTRRAKYAAEARGMRRDAEMNDVAILPVGMRRLATRNVARG
jgi:hypothetical protein